MRTNPLNASCMIHIVDHTNTISGTNPFDKLTFHVSEEAIWSYRVSKKGEKAFVILLFVMSRVLTKTEYDTYNPTLNQYLGDQRIRRKDAPALNDQKDTIAFEWMSVDLWVSFEFPIIL